MKEIPGLQRRKIMKNKILVCSLAFFLGAAAVFPGGDEFQYTVKITDSVGWSWEMSAARFEFRLGSKVLAIGTPTLFRRHTEELTTASAKDMNLILTKELDTSSPKLAEAMRSKTIFPIVELALMGMVGDKEIQVTYRLSNVSVSRITPSGEGELLSLNFEEIKIY